MGALPNLLDFVGPAGTIFERQPQIRQVASQQTGACRQGTCQGDHQSDPPDDIDMKREKPADQRNIQHPPADPGHDRQDAQHQTEKKFDLGSAEATLNFSSRS